MRRLQYVAGHARSSPLAVYISPPLGTPIDPRVAVLAVDFKVSIVQPLEEHGAWAEAEYNPLEEEFISALKGIDGVSQVETQEVWEAEGPIALTTDSRPRAAAGTLRFLLTDLRARPSSACRIPLADHLRQDVMSATTTRAVTGSYLEPDRADPT